MRSGQIATYTSPSITTWRLASVLLTIDPLVILKCKRQHGRREVAPTVATVEQISWPKRRTKVSPGAS